jgi:hypothetical protein
MMRHNGLNKLAQERDKRQAVVNTGMNLQAPKSVGIS